MKINRSVVFLIVVLLVLILAACTRAIPGTGDQATPAATGDQTAVLTPGSTDVMGQIYLFATQTAMAQQGGTIDETPVEAAPGTPAATDEASAAPTQPEAQPTQPAVQPTQPAPAQPAAPAAPVVPPPTPGIPTSYTLKGGEFPYCIARRFNVNPGELLRVNGLSSFSVFYTGMTLTIPQTGRPFPGNRSLRPHPTIYTVRPGDTIFKIACVFGDVSPDAIAAANGLAKPYPIAPGQILHIP